MLEQRRHLLPSNIEGFVPEQIAKEPNVILLDDLGNVALFEQERGGIYSGHYLFIVGGRQGLKSARAMLEWMFSRDAKVIKGLTPIENKKALWFSRQLGFQQIDTVHTPLGDMILQFMSSKDFKQ